jgi:hypothetical protein
MIPIVWIWKLCLLKENNKAPKQKDCAKAPNRGNFKSRGTNHEIEFESKLDILHNETKMFIIDKF